MLHPDKALAIVTETGEKVFGSGITPDEIVSIESATGRVLTSELVSPIDHPPFNKSAMDGFAFSSLSESDVFEVVELVPAGRTGTHKVEPGTATRIMTGAPIPDGADVVQRFEWTTSVSRGDADSPAADARPLVRFVKKETVTNIIKKGENLRAGEPLMSPRILAPQDIGILAAAGFAEVKVSGKIRVGVVSTGDEIVEPGQSLDAAHIYDSNGYQICAQAEAFGAKARFYGIVPDEKAPLLSTLSLALDESDLVIVSGGVSLGDFDLVPKVLEELGVEAIFHSLAMRPGKPTYFGTRGKTAVFGLPGNPVSAFVNFDFLVKPCIAAMQGVEYSPRLIRARLFDQLSRKGSDRVEFLPVRLVREEDGMSACPIRYRGSSMVTVLANADGFVRMEIGVDHLVAGEHIDVRLVRA
jgi:molybdopterin molybdotransferase